MNIDKIDMARIDRAVYSAVHGKKVVLDALLAAGKGWNHSSGMSYHHVTDTWRRGNWTLRVDWSEGGRIAGASLHEDQVDPDTGRIKVKGNGETVRYLIFGMTAGQRNKKERLIKILTAKPEDIKAIVKVMVEENIDADRARDVKRHKEIYG